MPTPPVTFAFSKKQDRWTTRYSFTPTCYANCGDVMLSSKDSSGIWRHDVNNSRNNFYGVQYGALIDMVSNDDPSAVKMFKSISLESNQKSWSATFFTNEEHQDGNNQKSNVVGGFKDKEGFKYLDVPRDTKNSTANLIPCVGMSLIDDAEIDNYSSYPVSINSHLSLPHGLLLGLHNGSVQSFSDFTGGQFTDVFLTSSYGEPGEVYLDLGANEYANNDEELISQLGQFLNGVNFVASDASVNGDQMRGPYMRVKLAIITNKPLELHAINIDYEFSKLDKRLTQSS